MNTVWKGFNEEDADEDEAINVNDEKGGREGWGADHEGKSKREEVRARPEEEEEGGTKEEGNQKLL